MIVANLSFCFIIIHMRRVIHDINRLGVEVNTARSFVVTGASATGKTTLIERALSEGYTHLPTHTTRPRRANEIDGIHSQFIDEGDFMNNFSSGLYIESSIDFAKLHATGTYYGTPIAWLDILRGKQKCATPVSTFVADIVFKETGVKWVHLVCDDDDRYSRLAARGIDETEIIARMSSGDSRGPVPSESTTFDTSVVSVDDILTDIIVRA